MSVTEIHLCPPPNLPTILIVVSMSFRLVELLREGKLRRVEEYERDPKVRARYQHAV